MLESKFIENFFASQKNIEKNRKIGKWQRCIYDKYQYNVLFRKIPILARNTETALSGVALSGVLLYMMNTINNEFVYNTVCDSEKSQ